jgi:hypothetical protein
MAKRLREAGGHVTTKFEHGVTLDIRRSRAGGVPVVDVEVRSGPLEGQRVRIIPTNPSSAYFNETPPGRKDDRPSAPPTRAASTRTNSG